VRWSVGRRLEFIDFRLFWDGRVNRSDLVSKFRISVPQASLDLGRYLDAAPGNTRYDHAEKTYVALPSFAPRFMRLSAGRLLVQLRALVTGLITPADTWFSYVPPVGVVPDLGQSPDPQRLRAVLRAIRDRSALEIVYRSLSAAEPGRRYIAPYALAHDGFRWNVRAWCEANSEFRDFLLTRIVEVGECRESRLVEPELDAEWTTPFTMRIGPHPRLSAEQRTAVELDYGMSEGVLEVPTTVYLAWYLTRRLLLDLPDQELTAERRQITLLNRQDLADAQREAKDRTAISTRSSLPVSRKRA
jgi:hypothetical protein